jgi:hypothetical protein
MHFLLRTKLSVTAMLSWMQIEMMVIGERNEERRGWGGGRMSWV